jgi:lipopolysaccharide transport system permease protein
VLKEMDVNPNEEFVSLNETHEKRLSLQMYDRSKQLFSFLFLVRQLVKIDITSAYRRSFIGLTWMVITPILSVVAWVLLRGAGILNPGDTGIPYPAYVLLSTSIWSFFLGAYQSTSQVLIAGSRLMVTVQFPHEVLVAKRIMVHLINFVIPFAVNLVVLMIYGVSFSWHLLIFPLSLLPLLLLGVSLGLIVALLRVVAFDFANLFDKAIQFLMFVTPIIYAPKVEIAGLATIIQYNPLTYLIGFSRDLLTKGTFYEPQTYALVSLGVLVLFLISYGFFVKFERDLVERMINV